MSEGLAGSFVAALNELEDIAREHSADMGTYRYRYADLAQVAQAARRTLGAHGLAVHQQAHSDQPGQISVTTTLWHVSGETYHAQPLTMQTKGGPQDVGSAITYARRYALMAFLGLATDDDDGAAAQRAATGRHPLADRVGDVLAGLKALSPDEQDVMRVWADGRKLAGAALLADETWLREVETRLSESETT